MTTMPGAVGAESGSRFQGYFLYCSYMEKTLIFLPQICPIAPREEKEGDSNDFINLSQL